MKNMGILLRRNEHQHWSMDRLHFHEQLELLLPLTNSGSIWINDQIYPLEQGTLYLIGSSALHRTIVKENHARYVLHISPDVLEQLSTPQTNFTALSKVGFCHVALNPQSLSQLLALFQELEQVRESNAYGNDLMQISVLLQLLIHVTPILTTSGQGQACPSQDFIRMEPIMEYIQNNLASSLSLDQLATHFFISKHYLCRVFKAATGFSVMEYIIQSRILRAQQFLQEGHSVQQSGELSGFSDNSHFIRTFRTQTGTSPGRYAKQHRFSDQIILHENALQYAIS